MKQIFDWLREQMRKHLYTDYTWTDFVEMDDAIRLVNEAEAKFGGHAICYLDSPCEYQSEDISVVDVGISCELLDKLVEPSKRCSHGLCEFRTHEECVSFEYCENCFVDAMKDVIKNSDSRFRKIAEVE